MTFRAKNQKQRTPPTAAADREFPSKLTSASNPRLTNWIPQTDAAAVALARDGDSEAFRALVERHSRAVYRLAHRMTGSAEDAEDVVQETFLKAYRQLNRFESRANFSTWLHRIAVNCSIDPLTFTLSQSTDASKPGSHCGR